LALHRLLVEDAYQQAIDIVGLDESAELRIVKLWRFDRRLVKLSSSAWAETVSCFEQNVRKLRVWKEYLKKGEEPEYVEWGLEPK
jgi:hypothetical protein